MDQSDIVPSLNLSLSFPSSLTLSVSHSHSLSISLSLRLLNSLPILLRQDPRQESCSQKICIWIFFAQKKNVCQHLRSRVTLKFVKQCFFCRTSLPLASTRWVRSAFSSVCPLSSNQRHLNKLRGYQAPIFYSQD